MCCLVGMMMRAKEHVVFEPVESSMEFQEWIVLGDGVQEDGWMESVGASADGDTVAASPVRSLHLRSLVIHGLWMWLYAVLCVCDTQQHGKACYGRPIVIPLCESRNSSRSRWKRADGSWKRLEQSAGKHELLMMVFLWARNTDTELVNKCDITCYSGSFSNDLFCEQMVGLKHVCETCSHFIIWRFELVQLIGCKVVTSWRGSEVDCCHVWTNVTKT